MEPIVIRANGLMGLFELIHEAREQYPDNPIHLVDNQTVVAELPPQEMFNLH